MCRRTGDDWQLYFILLQVGLKVMHEFVMFVWPGLPYLDPFKVLVNWQVRPKQDDSSMRPWYVPQLHKLSATPLLCKPACVGVCVAMCCLSKALDTIVQAKWQVCSWCGGGPLCRPQAWLWLHSETLGVFDVVADTGLFHGVKMRWKRVLFDQHTWEYEPWSQFPSDYVDTPTSSHKSQGASFAKYFVRWRRQYAKRDQKWNGDLLGYLAISITEIYEPESFGVPVPTCGTYARGAGSFFQSAHCEPQGQELLDIGWHGVRFPGSSQRLLDRLEPSWLVLWLDMGAADLWLWIPPVQECTCLALGSRWQWAVDQMETVCFRSVMVKTHFACRPRQAATVGACFPSCHPACLWWEGAGKIFEFLGQTGYLSQLKLVKLVIDTSKNSRS